MSEQFVDYFEACGLNPSDRREDNYKLLLKAHLKAKDKRGRAGKMEELLLSEAMRIFNEPNRYDEYRAVWERRRQKRPDTTPDKRPQPDTSESGPQETDGAQEGFWSVLGKVALKGIEYYMENKRSQEAPQSQEATPQRQGLGSSLSGVWRDSAGNPTYVQQSGNVVAVKALDGYGRVFSEGRGIIRGRTIEYEGQNLTGQVGRGVFALSGDGTLIDGQISWWHFNMPVGTFHVCLFRE
jgi:hypothetical protein